MTVPRHRSRHPRIALSELRGAVQLAAQATRGVATLAARRGTLAERLVGDGLVPLRSALGQHDNPKRDLGLRAHPHWISHGTGHIELLRRPDAWKQITRWLLPSR